MDTQSTIESWTGRAYKALDGQNRGYILKHELLDLIEAEGVSSHQNLEILIQTLQKKRDDEPITFKEFEELTSGLIFLRRVLEFSLVIPQYEPFSNNLKNLYDNIKEDKNNEF
jgi:hypothetical protein